MSNYKKLLLKVEESIASYGGFGCEPFDLDLYLCQMRKRSELQSKIFLPDKIILNKLAISTMLHMTRYAQEGAGNKHRSSFISQAYRSLNLLIGSSELLISGLEDPARVLSRSYFESLDVLTAILSDKEFAERHFEIEDSNKFWSEKVGYGKINSYVKKALLKANMSGHINEFLASRRVLKNALSAAVHSDSGGAFRSWAVPAIGKPGMISDEPHGVVSFHSESHFTALSSETYRFLSIFANLLMMNELEGMHKFSKSSEDSKLFMSYLFVFQEYMFADKEDIYAKEWMAEFYKN